METVLGLEEMGKDPEMPPASHTNPGAPALYIHIYT